MCVCGGESVYLLFVSLLFGGGDGIVCLVVDLTCSHIGVVGQPASVVGSGSAVCGMCVRS